MTSNKHISRRFGAKAYGAFFLLLTAVVVLVFCSIGRHNDLDETYQLAKETESFLETTCQKYENYNKGNSAKSLQHLLDTAIGLRDFIDPSTLENSDYLIKFIRSEHLGGILLLDASGKTVAQADMDDQDSSELWRNAVQSQTVQDIMKRPAKTICDTEELDGITYNYAAISYQGGLLLCYESTEKPSYDPYEFNVSNILPNDTFRKNPTAIIAKGNQILSTNDSSLEEAVAKQDGFAALEIEWRDDALTKFEYEGKTWYGLRSVYENYGIYLLYPESEVFSSTGTVVSLGLIAYLAICSAILILRGYFYKKNLRTAKKQLRIINAISATYQSTFLFHIGEMELEPINLSSNVARVFEKHPEPHDFLKHVCLDVVAPESRDAAMELVNPDTIEERLKGNTFIACEVKDLSGTWHSLQVIPQRTSEEGKLLTVLIATRNITTLKQAEMLSYHDKLTGLHNRNYMESHSMEFTDNNNYPLSVIMADCNYLKRTNDTLGHTWGDTLLQRTAEALREATPETATIMRIGGDEFLIVYPNAAEEDATKLIQGAKTELAKRSDSTLTISVSFGSCTVKNNRVSFEQACQAADEAMYREKHAAHRANGSQAR